MTPSTRMAHTAMKKLARAGLVTAMAAGLLVPVGAATAAATAAASAPAWSFEALDGAASVYPGHGPTAGADNAVTLYQGQIHLFTGDSAGTMRHDWWDGSRWHFEALDGPASAYAGHDPNALESTTVTLYNGQIHVFAFDAVTGALRHDWWDGSRWHFEALDGPGSAFPVTPRTSSDSPAYL